MQSGDRESTQDWLVPDDLPGEIAVGRTPAAQAEPDWGASTEILAEAERAAEAASAAAERAGISSSTAEDMLRRAERALSVDREASRSALDAAVSAERAASSAAALDGRYKQDFERLYDSSAQAASHAQRASAAAERAGDAAVAARAEVSAGSAAAEGTMTKIAERVETTLAKLEARERAEERRAGEAAADAEALRKFSSRADRIVVALKGLEDALANAGR